MILGDRVAISMLGVLPVAKLAGFESPSGRTTDEPAARHRISHTSCVRPLRLTRRSGPCYRLTYGFDSPHASDSMSVTVADLMSEPVLTVNRDDGAGEVARAMVESEVHSVVVIDEDCHPKGILTSTDYLRMTAEGVDPHTESVASVMTTGIVTATPDEPVEVAAARMAEHGLGHLPIVDEERVVTGILSATDLTVHLGTA